MNKEPLREITEEDIRTFEEQGAVCLRQVFDSDWVERMREAADVVLADPGPTGIELNPPGTEGRFFNENHIWTYNDDFRALLFESPMPYVAQHMLRSKAVNIVYDFLLVKEPHTPYPTDWHQDESANPMDGPKIGGTWLPLDYVDLESGAIEFVKGSHRWGKVFRNVYDSGEGFFNGFKDEPVDADRPEDVFVEFPDIAEHREKYEKDIMHYETEPGDVVFTSSRVLHWSPGNFTDRRRRALGYRWAGDGSTYARRTSEFRLLPPCDPQVAHGAHFPKGDHHLYPRVWPRRRHKGQPLLGLAVKVAQEEAAARASAE